MKFDCVVTIDRPADAVARLYVDRTRFAEWQPDLLGDEHLDGTPGTVGARHKLHYRSGSHEFDLFETATSVDLPREVSGEYETKGVCWNSMKTVFHATSDQQTEVTVSIEYKFYGFMVKVFGFLMPWKFRQQVQQFLERFKTFAEAEMTEPNAEATSTS